MSPRRKLLVAIGIGVVLAGPPVAALNLWLGSLVDRQGQEELDMAARRHMVLSEARIERAVSALDELAARGVDSCRVTHVDALRQMTFAATPVKELSIIAADGRTLCTDVGNQPRSAQGALVRAAVGRQPQLARTGSPWWTFRALASHPPSRRHRQRHRRPYSGVAVRAAGLDHGHAASLPGPDAHRRRRGDRRNRRCHAASSSDPQPGGDVIVSELASSRYGLKATVSASHRELAANQGDLRALGTIASGLLAIAILALSLLLPKRDRDNPIEEIERALKAGEFVPYFQPIVDIRSGRLRGAEVLIRWRKPDGTIIPPASFIPLCESSGLIIDVTRALMRRVCQEAGAVIGARPHLKIGFNLTARHFANEEIVEDVRKIFTKSRAQADAARA